MVGIPKVLGHIWIGPRQPPLEWMQTWRDLHPDWDYRLYDNDFLVSRPWKNQEMIIGYLKRGRYEGVADLMRYEILHEHGGFMPDADSTARHKVDDLFAKPHLYAVYENETIKPGLISPFIASTPGHPFLHHIVETIYEQRVEKMNRSPWRVVGNRFLGREVKDFIAREGKLPDAMTMLPSYTFNPVHKDSEKEGAVYTGPETVYADQHWGTTTGGYDHLGTEDKDTYLKRIIPQLKAWLKSA